MRTLQENGKTYAVVPLKTYQKLLRQSEDEADIAAFDAAMARRSEAFPLELFEALDKGANPTLTFRNYRGMSLKSLAAKAGISQPYLSQLESGKRRGSSKTLKRIASALKISLDLLVWEKE